jgi:hypothetical protein
MRKSMIHSVRRRVASLGVLAAAFFFGVAAHGWAQAPPQFEATLKKMLTALESNAPADFVAEGDPAFQAAIIPPMFNNLSRQLGTRLKNGYTATYLAELKQQGYTVYLWKLGFSDSGDDVLVTMAIKDGKVGGFWLR